MIELRPVGHVLGWLLLVLGVLMVPPLAADVLVGDANARAFAASAIVAVFAGAALALASAGRGPLRLSQRQGFVLTTGSWLAFPAVGALPMMLGAPQLSFTDAYFEAMSAMTTTGATVIVGLDGMPRGLLLWRGLLQWIGGIGIVLMALIILPALNAGGMQLLRSADFNTLDKVLPRTKAIAAAIGSIYVGLSLACMMGYLWSGMGPFDAAVHAMTTLATGGMGTYDASFGLFSPAAQYVAVAFMLLGSLSFVRFVQLLRGAPGKLWRDIQIRAFLAVYAGFVAAVAAARVLQGAPAGEQTLREVMFNVASLLSTTGYASTDYGLWADPTVTLVFCIMMVGGCSGSTAGGVKIFRYQLLLATVAAELRRLYRPSVVILPRYQGRRVSEPILDSVIAFVMFYFLSLGVLSVLLVLVGLDPLTAISGAATCLGNVGPGLGAEIGPAGNFAELPGAAKWLLSAAMLIGRLEIMVVFVLFTAGFWRG